MNSAAKPSDGSCALPAADWTIGGQRLGATVTATTVLVCVKAAATVSVTWATAASVAAAPFLRGLGGNGDEGLL